MSRRLARSWMRLIALAAAGGSIALIALGTMLLVLNGQSVLDGFHPHLILVGTLFAGIGGLIAAKIPANRLGLVMALGSLLWAASFVGEQYAWFATFTQPGTLPAAAVAEWTQSWIWMPGTVILLTGLPLLFPDGDLPSRRWRPVVVLIAIGAAFATVAQAIGMAGLSAAEILTSEPQVGEMPGALGFFASVGQLTIFVVGPVTAMTALVVRSRRSSGVERQQMHWFTYALGVTIAGSIADQFIAPLLGLPNGITSIVGLVLIPVSMAVAIFRYHLYEIDRIVSRTVGYGLITGVLAVVFVGAVFAFQAILAPMLGENPVGVAASTLIVAALFQPLRRRVQRVVDRRFDRTRYDAERTIAAFSARLRDDVDLASLELEVRGVVVQTVAPATVGLWMLRSDAET